MCTEPCPAQVLAIWWEVVGKRLGKVQGRPAPLSLTPWPAAPWTHSWRKMLRLARPANPCGCSPPASCSDSLPLVFAACPPQMRLGDFFVCVCAGRYGLVDGGIRILYGGTVSRYRDDHDSVLTGPSSSKSTVVGPSTAACSSQLTMCVCTTGSNNKSLQVAARRRLEQETRS